jgi:alpha-galactosidase
MTPRIAFIGAGSVEFTKNLLGDILAFPELANAEIALHDIDSERLQTAEAMARWTAGALNASPTIEAHLDRRAAIDGADFVINMIQVGGHAATLLDFEIPKRYGLRQTIADTLGIGGIFRGLRTIPVMLDIAHEMADLCPDAWLINYTNPMATLCQATYKGVPGTKIVGLCHSVQHTTRELADLVDVPYDEVSHLVAGVNHQAFVLAFSRGDEDLLPAIRRALTEDPRQANRVRVELFKHLGYFSTESSEHAAEYVPWFMHDESAIERFHIPEGEYVRRSEEALVEYEEARRKLKAGEDFPLERSVEYGSLIIHSLTIGTPRVFAGNVRNDGYITNLPEGACVEVPCRVDANGIHPTRVGELPPQLAALNHTYLNVVELTVRAALERRRDYVYHAAMLDPNASASLSLDAIHAMVDDLIDAHGAALHLDGVDLAPVAGVASPSQ